MDLQPSSLTLIFASGDADNGSVRSRVRVLRELLGQSMYVVDEGAVADAVVLRAKMRVALGEQTFRSEHRGPEIRSFRRDRGARSFRLSASARTRRVYH